MSEENTGIQETRKETGSLEKIQTLEGLLPSLHGRNDLIISGSLSEKISELEEGGSASLRPEDLTLINDIDILSTNWDTDEIEQTVKAVSEKTGFPAEVAPVVQNCVYPSSGVRDLAVAQTALTVQRNGESKTYDVYYTTPEFLLLTLADQEVTDKTPSEKYKRKVLAIQNNPKFSKDRFSDLALNELAVRYAMNEDTFRVWSRMVQEEGESADLEAEFEAVKSLVDQAGFFNAVKKPSDQKNLDYSDIRKISQLEHFLREMEEEL